MTVSVSGRGSRVSADKLNSSPQNSRLSKMRLKGSPPSMRRNSARTRLICCSSNARSGMTEEIGLRYRESSGNQSTGLPPGIRDPGCR